MDKKSLTVQLATRNRTAKFMTSGMYLPNPDPILKKLGKDIETYEELLSDSKVAACASSRKAGVQKLEWYIKPGKTPEQIVTLFEEHFKNTLRMRETIDGILEAPLFGYSPLEISWAVKDGRIMPEALTAKPPEWFVYGEDNEIRFLSREAPISGVLLPDRKFIIARHGATYKNPYGRPVLASCFWPCTFKKGGIKFWAIFAEKYGSPFLVGKHPRGAAQKEIDEMADALENMIQDAVCCVPDDSKVEIIEAAGKSASGDLYAGLKTAMNDEIALSILGQTLSSEIGSTGSYAASQSHMEVRGDIIDGDKALCESVLNELIRMTCEMNFPNVEPPQIEFYQEEDVDKVLAERDKVLSDLGVRFSPEYITRAYGFDEGDVVSVEAPVGSAPNTPPASFAEEDTQFADQYAVDGMVNGLPGKELNAEAKKLFGPIMDMIDKAASFEEIQKKLPDLYPDLDPAEFTDRLTKALFLAEIIGRNGARQERE